MPTLSFGSVGLTLAASKAGGGAADCGAATIRKGRHRQKHSRRNSAGNCHKERTSPAARLPAVEHCPDARRQIGPVRHRKCGRSSDCGSSSRQSKKLIRVRGCLGISQNRIVAGTLCFECEPPPRDPDQRMEPVRRALQPGPDSGSPSHNAARAPVRGQEPVPDPVRPSFAHRREGRSQR